MGTRSSLATRVGGFGSDGRPSASSSRTSAPGASPPGSAPSSDSSDVAGLGPYELLFNNNGVDLDADTPRVATDADPSIDIYDGGGTIDSYPVWAGLAKWAQAGPASRADCLALLNSFATISSTYVKGSRYCVHTKGERHVAFIEFVEPIDGGWKIRVTVWPGTAA